MKAIEILSIIVVVVVVAALIGLSIYYNVKQVPVPTSIPDLLGFKSVNTTQKTSSTSSSHTVLGMGPVEVIGFGVGGAVVGIIIVALFVSRNSFGPTY
jgi:hypothetical protein